MHSSLCLSILLTTFVGQVFGQDTFNQCFASHLSADAAKNACCGHAVSDGSGTGDVNGMTFDYTCNAFASPIFKFEGSFNNAYACAKQCADSAQCTAAVWGYRLHRCWYTTNPNPQRTAPGTSPDYITLENKRPTSSRPSMGTKDCKKLVDEATADCESMERKNCQRLLDTQADDIRETQRQEGTEKCSEQKEKLKKRYEEDREAKEMEHNQELKRLKEENARLREQNRRPCTEDGSDGNNQPNHRTGEPRGSSPGPSSRPMPPIPSDNQLRCPEFDGKEYTVFGVTYKVFCGTHPKGKSMVGGTLHRKDPEFLMAMCSVDTNCQGIKSQTHTAELMLEHEYPPTQKSASRGWWSLIPVNRKSDQSVMSPDPFSQTPDSKSGPGTDQNARCPLIDGKVLSVYGNEFRINCRRSQIQHSAYSKPIARSLRQCLVSCSIDEKCEGVSYTSICLLLAKHEALEQVTPKNRLSSDSYVAMLTGSRSSTNESDN